jgi:hypothetical protein
MELIFQTASVNLPQSIANLEQLKADLIPRLEKYKTLVVTEDSIKAAKDDKAALNKLKKAIEEQRISIKKQFLEPYNLLEAQCKEVIALIDEPVKAIDAQIKAFDEIEKKEKLAQLQTAFYRTEHPNWLQFNHVCPEKWENKTAKTDKLIEQIEQRVASINSDIAEIDAIYAESPLLTAIADRYKKTLDKAETLTYAVQLEQQEKAERERRERERAEAIKQAERAESECNAPIIDSNEGSINIPASSQNAENGLSVSAESAPSAPEIITGRFEVTGTKDQIRALGSFMKAQGINFKVI